MGVTQLMFIFSIFMIKIEPELKPGYFKMQASVLFP